MCVCVCVCELLLFNHFSDVLIVSMAFFFLVPAKPMSDRTLQRTPFSQPLLAYSMHSIHYFFMSLGIHHIWISSVHGPLLRVPPMELSIPILFFSLFYLKISIFLGIVMFEQCSLGILILSLNQALIPILLPVTVHLVWAFLVIWHICTDGQTDYLHNFF